MSFNPDKYEVIRIANKPENIFDAQYSIHGTSLPTVDEAKYLGVTIQSNLNQKLQINNISKKANSTFSFLRRNLSTTTKNIKEQECRTYVRPTLGSSL